MSGDNMILKELLIQYEIQNDLSHVQMAKKLDVSLSTYYRWITGESTKLKKRTVENLSHLLDCDIDRVLDESSRIKPILGEVKAGYDLWAEQNVEGYVELGKSDSKHGDYFLRVTGDSMEGCHIYDGDLIFVEACSSVRSGQIAVVLQGDEATVKKVYYKNDLIILEAANPKYESKIFTIKEAEELPVRVLGLVRFVRRDFV